MDDLEAKVRCLEVATQLCLRGQTFDPGAVASLTTTLYTLIIDLGKADTRKTLGLPSKK